MTRLIIGPRESSSRQARRRQQVLGGEGDDGGQGHRRADHARQPAQHQGRDPPDQRAGDGEHQGDAARDRAGILRGQVLVAHADEQGVEIADRHGDDE